MRNILILLVMLVLGTQHSIFGQQDAQYTQYMYNTLAVNPAYAGSREVWGIAALHRSQWVGLDGAPSTQTFNMNGPVSDKIGMGLSILHDEIGNNTNQNTYFDATFSYAVSTSEVSKLSFGLKAGGHLLNIDFNQLRNYRPNISIQSNDQYQKFSPNFGAGLYYYSPNFYIGLSIPNILKTEHFQDSGDKTSYIATARMNWYLISGYVFELNPNLKFKPALLFKVVEGAPLQADFSANFLLSEKFTMGAAYRWDAAFSGLFGFQMSDQFMVGLAYDREITELGGARFNDGSFELFLRYEFRKKNKIELTPRFF